MCLTKFFLEVKLQKCSRFFKKREQFTDSAVALTKTKRDFLKIVTRRYGELAGLEISVRNRYSLLFRHQMQKFFTFFSLSIEVFPYFFCTVNRC